VRPVLHGASANWAAGRARAREQVDWEQWRERAKAIRTDAIAHLPELLEQLCERIEAAGGTVHRAQTGAAARRIVAELCAQRGLERAIKSKSMLSEEIGLNDALEAAGIDVVETDLGEWILQLLGDRPSHILAPAVHLSAERVAELFSEHSGTRLDAADTRKLVGYARGALRAAFLAGDVGITGSTSRSRRRAR